MADVNIVGKISVDAGQSTKSIADLKKEINESKKALEGAKIGSVEYKAAQDKLSKSTEELSQSTAKSTGGFGKLKEGLGGVIPGFSGASSGAAGLGKQLMLLVVNPIVLILAAIVGGLTLLFKAFASTNEGADKLAQMMAGLSATIDVVRDRILVVGEALKKFFSGDFKGAIDTGRQAVAGFGAEVAKEFQEAANGVKALQEVEDAVRSLGVSRAKLNRDLANAKEIISDETASYKDKKKAIEEVRIAEEAQTKAELANAQKKLAAITKANSLSDTSDADLQKQADAEAALFNLQQQSAQNRKILNKQERAAESQERIRVDAISKARDERIKAERDKKSKDLDDYIKNEVDKVKAEKLVIDDMNRVASEFDKIEKEKKEKERAEDIAKKVADGKFLEQQVAFKKKLGEAEVLTRLAQQSEINASLENSILIFGKTSIAGKALAISQALINTYLGATSVLSSKSTLPSPFDFIAKAVNVAAVLASGFSSIKAITAVKVPGGGGGGSVPRPSGAASTAPVLPQQTSTSLNAASIQGVGNAAAGGVNGRAFVLDSDIKNNQERAARLQRAARLD
jgi:uncharacterized phage infection (PIP) family protein YhgE